MNTISFVIRNVLTIILLSTVFLSSNAQEVFIKEELKGFVEVYMNLKNQLPDNQNEAIKLFQTYSITQTRYKEIANARVHNSKINLSQNEIDFFDELAILDIKFQKQKNQTTKLLCDKNQIEIEVYEKILKGYKTDVKFQRSLQPYFTDFINRSK